MNSPQLWGTGLGVLVCYLRLGGVVAGTTVLCVEQNSIGSSKQGLLGVALQRRSWAPTFVWQVELMTQEDVPWSRASWEGRRRGRPEAVQVRADFLCAAPGFVLSQIQFDSRRSSGAREIASICLEFFIFGFKHLGRSARSTR